MKKAWLILWVNLLVFFESSPVILEELQQNGTLEIFLENKTIGFYVGSFDPVHLAHKAFAERVIKERWCDFVLMYPVWGGDDYKKKLPVDVRLDMLLADVGDHPFIIVTKLEPRELQKALTEMDTMVGRSPHKKVISGFVTKPVPFIKDFIGLLGSDQALALGVPAVALGEEKHRQLWLTFFMRGYIVHEAYYDTDRSLASISALPVSSFIVSIRNEDDVSVLNNHIGDREFRTIILEVKLLRNLSSSLIKDLMQKDSQIARERLAPPVWEMIEEGRLYRRSSSSSVSSDGQSDASSLSLRLAR
jgi:nicotinic acid mononucleotide adenylyltransferase